MKKIVWLALDGLNSELSSDKDPLTLTKGKAFGADPVGCQVKVITEADATGATTLIKPKIAAVIREKYPRIASSESRCRDRDNEETFPPGPEGTRE